MTRDKAKDIMVAIRPKLSGMIAKYELSGAGSGQKNTEEDGYGHVDLDLCEDRDDRRNFIKSDSESYLLYWWHRLDEEDFVQFTICALDKFHRSNATEFTRVFNERKSDLVRIRKDDVIKEKMAENMGRVGDGVLSLSIVNIQREIESWEATAFDLSDRLFDLEDGELTDRTISRITNIKKRIFSLEEKIEGGKKRCAALDDN